MKEHNETGTIPTQTEGKEIVAYTTRVFEDIAAAVAMYEVASLRLLDVNRWHELTQQPFTKFQVTDAQGNALTRTVAEGDYMKIDVPGPGTEVGDGSDWVKVELVKEYEAPQVKSMGIRVRPTVNPSKKVQATAHFYSHGSTSTFTVTQEGNNLTAAIYDRNTQINEASESLGDEIRNTLVGMIGLGFYSQHQWKLLTEGLLK